MNLVCDVVADLAGGEAGAEFSICRRYRYRLWRIWDPALAPLNFLMLNPSKADAHIVDTTTTRCIRFAHREGAGGIVLTNLFAWRSTAPEVLPDIEDPVGPGNDDIILAAAAAAKFTIAAWGHWGGLRDRGRAVRDMLAAAGHDLHVLGLTAGGEPRHPSRLPKLAPLTPWN